MTVYIVFVCDHKMPLPCKGMRTVQTDAQYDGLIEASPPTRPQFGPSAKRQCIQVGDR